MTPDQPTPPESPASGKGKEFGVYLAGVIVGFGLIAAAVLGPSWKLEELGWMLLTPFGVIPIGLLLAIPRSTRSFGLGVASAVPIGLMLWPVICGIGKLL